jgi:hypothetical protein
MQRSLKQLAVFLSAASTLTLAPLAGAQDHPEGPPAEHILQYAGRVGVGEDGNGVTAAAFRTTVAGETVRYYMLIENGCRRAPDPAVNEAEPCPAPVSAISISLNEQVVFQTTDEFQSQRVEVALNAPGTTENKIVITAGGEPRSGARVSVLAIRPAQVAVGGRSILPWAWTDELTRSWLTIHNAGPSPMAVRIVFFHPDGTTAGESTPRILPVHATANLDLAAIARNLELGWTRGAVHVRWAARNFSRMSSVASEVHRERDESGNLEVTNARELALDDYGPFPINTTDLRQIFGDN